MAKLREVKVPTLGNVTFQSITFGVLVDIEDKILALPEDERSKEFTNQAVAAMLMDPELSPSDIKNLGTDALEVLCRHAAEFLGAADEFAELKDIALPEERLYEARRRSWQKYVIGLNESVTRALDMIAAPLQSQISNLMKQSTSSAIAEMASKSIEPFRDSLGNMAALSYRIASPQPAYEHLKKSIKPINEAFKRLSIGKSLADMATEVTKSLPSEPLLSSALISSGLNPPFLHSPTFPSQTARIIDLENWTVAKEETEHSRRVDAFDTLSSLEEALRDLISKLMNDEYGPKWWKQKVPQDVKDACNKRKNEKEKPNRPSFHPIYYAHVGDYLKIIGRSDNWKSIFQSIFDNRTELEASFIWVIRVRDPVVHSRPVDDKEYTMFYAGSLWLRERIDQAFGNII